MGARDGKKILDFDRRDRRDSTTAVAEKPHLQAPERQMSRPLAVAAAGTVEARHRAGAVGPDVTKGHRLDRFVGARGCNSIDLLASIVTCVTLMCHRQR